MLRKLLALVFALFIFNAYFFGYMIPLVGQLSFVTLVISIHLFLALAFFDFKQRTNRWALAGSLVALAASLMALLRANGFDHFLLFLLSGAATVVTTYFYVLAQIPFGALSEFVVMPARLGMQWLRRTLTVIDLPEYIRSHWFSSVKHRLPRVSEDKLFKIVRSLVITLPIVGVVILLLSAADPIFASILGKLLNWRFPQFIFSLPARLVWSIGLLVLLTPLVWIRIQQPFISPMQSKRFSEFSLEALMLLGAVSSVLAVFIIIQFRYLFTNVPEISLHQFGVQTYSEYVRRGFMELVLVSIIIYVVSGFAMVVGRVSEQQQKWLKWLNIGLLSEGLLFIFSIFRRVMIYQQEHGLTRGRLYGSYFLIALMLLTIVLMLRIVWPRLRDWYRYEIGIVGLILFVIPILNTDRLIATIFQPTVNQQIDYVYLSRLSSDGWQGWLASYQAVEGDLSTLSTASAALTDEEARKIVYANRVMIHLYNNYLNLVAKYGTDEELAKLTNAPGYKIEQDHRELNLAEHQAYQTLKPMIDSAKLNNLYFQTISLYSLLSPAQQQRQYDRSFNSPLL